MHLGVARKPGNAGSKRLGEVRGRGGGETRPGMGDGAQESGGGFDCSISGGIRMRGCLQVPGGAPPHPLFGLRRLERVSFILNARRLTYRYA